MSKVVKPIPDIVYQEETNECGLACVTMLCDMLGRPNTLDNLRNIFPPSEHGTTLWELTRILEQLGVPTSPVRFDPEEFNELPLPAILHYGYGHYVLLCERKGSHVCVMNPGMGLQMLPISALKHDISGYALILDEVAGTDPALQPAIEPVKDPLGHPMSLKGTAKVKGIYPLMLTTFIISLTLFIMPTMVSNAINQAFTTPTGAENFPYFWFVVAFITSTLLALFIRYITERFIKKFAMTNAAVGFQELLRNPLSFFEKRPVGDVYTRYTAWQGTLLQKIELDNGLRTDWIIVAVSLGVMYWISPILALIASVSVTIMGLISVWALYRDRMYTQLMQQKSGALNDFFMETLNGVLTVKTARLTKEREIRFAQLNADVLTTNQKMKIWAQIKSSLYQLTSTLEMVIFFFVALRMVFPTETATMSLGAFFAYGFVKQIFTSYVTQIFGSIVSKFQINVIDKRAQSLFKAPEVTEELDSQLIQKGHHLELENVCYTYPGHEPTLDNVSLNLPQGHQIAIRGESGAGKSTLLRLMAGLMLPDTGLYKLNGYVTNSRTVAELVFLQTQDDVFFKGTLFDNITLFAEDTTHEDRERVQEILALLQMDQVIAGMQGGLNALISENHTALSLGQRQRLLLARALFSKSPILLLDEPTANLDDETAWLVMNAVKAYCQKHGKTVVIVTHSRQIESLFSEVYVMADRHLVPLAK